MKKLPLLIVATVIVQAVVGAEIEAPLAQIKNPARIMANRTYYDRKDGIVIFSGNVHVDDSTYQMHSHKAYLFMSETNDVKRIVAQGNVAITNGNKRAYGTKATYRRDVGVVVLYGEKGTPAEVREIDASGDRTVKGKRIRFWVNAEQVEVLEADISAPTRGFSL